MEKLIKRIHAKVTEVCERQAEKDSCGYAQAAWFKESGHEQVKENLTEKGFKKWLNKAIELGYTADDVETIRTYIDGYRIWHEWVKFELEIPVYGKYSSFETIKFPKNSELPKDFVISFAKREEEEQAKQDTERKKERLEREAKMAEHKRQETEKRIRLEKEKQIWITEHGSDYLKRATKLNYNCQRKYITERVALEYPDYQIDFDERAEWKDRSCPSLAALDEVEELIEAKVKAKVVWLTRQIENDDYPWDPCEAVVIQEYLSKYNLVKII